MACNQVVIMRALTVCFVVTIVLVAVSSAGDIDSPDVDNVGVVIDDVINEKDGHVVAVEEKDGDEVAVEEKDEEEVAVEKKVVDDVAIEEKDGDDVAVEEKDGEDVAIQEGEDEDEKDSDGVAMEEKGSDDVAVVKIDGDDVAVEGKGSDDIAVEKIDGDDGAVEEKDSDDIAVEKIDGDDVAIENREDGGEKDGGGAAIKEKGEDDVELEDNDEDDVAGEENDGGDVAVEDEENEDEKGSDDVAVEDGEDEDDVAVEENDHDTFVEKEEKMVLYQLDPVQVGYVQEVVVGPGRTVQMKTVSIKPPVFEIFNLLTPDECDHLIKLGEDQGLHPSATITGPFNQRYGLYAEDGVTLVYNETEWNQTFNRFDLNLDGKIDYTELHGCLPGLKDRGMDLSLAQVMKLFADLDLDSDSNGVLNLNEFWAMMSRSLGEQVENWLGRLEAGEIRTDEKVKGQPRISKQAWVPFVSTTDQVLNELPYRISALTGLHPDIIRSSESIQVARYYPGGYYHAHYDSTKINPEKNCIQSMMTLRDVTHTHPLGRICRYLTIMTYLNDVQEGGETAFPLADNETYSQEDFIKNEYRMTDLKNHCQDSNMVVQPAKGKTVMWYNHHLHPQTGWLGRLHEYSLHGGCKVTRGVKWIANNWIAVDDIYNQQMEFQKKYLEKHTTPAKPGPIPTIASTETEPSTVESSTGTGDRATLSSARDDDVNITAPKAPNAASEAPRGDSVDEEGEPLQGHVDESRDTFAGSDEIKDEL